MVGYGEGNAAGSDGVSGVGEYLSPLRIRSVDEAVASDAGERRYPRRPLRGGRGGGAAPPRGGAVPGGPDTVAGPIRVGTAPDPDAAHRVGPPSGGPSEGAGMGETGDVGLSGPDALGHRDPEGAIPVGTPAGSKTGGAHHPAPTGGPPPAMACRPARERPVAGSSPPRRAPRLRGTREFPVSQRMGLHRQARVLTGPASAVSKGSHLRGDGRTAAPARWAESPYPPPVAPPTAGRLTGGRSRMHKRVRPDLCGGPGTTRVPTAMVFSAAQTPKPRMPYYDIC